MSQAREPMLNLKLRQHFGELMLAESRVKRIRIECASGKCNQFRLVLTAATLLGTFAAAIALACQEPQPTTNSAEGSGVVLRQTVRRVRVDVSVTDEQGSPVTGLQASDFRVSEDGRPQSIRQFEWQGEETKPANAAIRPVLPPHIFMNLPEASEHGPLTVLLYDVLNTPLEAQPYAHQQMVKFLQQSTGQPIAIFVLSDRLHLLQGFTSDSELIQRAANHSSTMPKRQSLLATTPSATGMLADAIADQATATTHHQDSTSGSLESTEEAMARMETEEASFMLDRRVDLTLEAFEQIGRFLSGIAGRKNLIWYSGSFPTGILPDQDKGLFNNDSGRNYSDRLRIATDLLNEAEAAVYPVDARGLQTNLASSASQSSPPGGARSTPQSAMTEISRNDEQIAAEHSSMDAIGEQTGGRAFYNTNGLDQVLEKASLDGSSYYSLVYAPANNKFDGAVRRISVSLEHNHYHLAYRRSYFADDVNSTTNGKEPAEEDNTPSESMTAASQSGAPPAHQLIFAAQVDAIGTPAPATLVQMAALDAYHEKAAKAASREFVKPTAPIPLQQYVIRYSVLTRQLALPISVNNVYQPQVSLAALAFNAEGETLWGIRSRIEDAIPAPEIDKFLQNGCRAVQTLLVPVGAAIIRLVVRDDHSGRIGSMEIRLPLSPENLSTGRAR